MPVAGSPTRADAWILDTFLTATQDRHKGGHPFGGDNVETACAIFRWLGRDDFRDIAGGFNERSEALLPR